jgi:hypothetical protein
MASPNPSRSAKPHFSAYHAPMVASSGLHFSSAYALRSPQRRLASKLPKRGQTGLSLAADNAGGRLRPRTGVMRDDAQRQAELGRQVPRLG